MVEVTTYERPEHGWTCFHCGETFTTPGSARDHFGFEPSSDPACRIKLGAERGLVMALRKAEMEIADMRQDFANENTEAAKQHYSQATRHHAQIGAAEEAGYERGLADGRIAERERCAGIAKTGWVSADYNIVGIADADMAMRLCEHIETAIREQSNGA